MSLVDRFENQQEQAFTRSYDRESARRQFRVSLVLVAAMATAAFVLGFAMPVEKFHTSKSAPVAQNESVFSGRLVTIDDR